MKNIDPILVVSLSDSNAFTAFTPYWRVNDDNPTLSEDGDRQVTKFVVLQVATIIFCLPSAVEVKTQRMSSLLDENEPRKFNTVPPEFGPETGTTSLTMGGVTE
jgi:hypothetical protein